MARIETIWEKIKPFAIDRLEIWAMADGTDSASNLYDVSGNARNFSVGSTPPILQTNLNGLQTIYFDGTKNPLSWTGTAFNLKHCFLVVAVEGNTFDAARGLLTGITTNPFLVGVNATDKFNDNGLGTNFSYKKADVAFANNNLKAPVASKFKIIEFVCPDGIDIANLQIGKDRNNAGTNLKGWVAEIICYSRRRGWHVRQQIYKYFANKYYLWRELSDGKLIFPFHNNHASPNKPIAPGLIRSKMVSSGRFKESRSGSILRSFDFGFEPRRQFEIDAISKFEEEVLGKQSFALENNSFYPPRRINVRMLGEGIEINPIGVNLFGYKFSAQQVDNSVHHVMIDFDEVIDEEPPSVPTNLVLTVISHNRIDVEFDPSTGDPINYRLLWADNAGFTGATTEELGTDTTFSIIGLSPETEYWFKVSAGDAEGNYSDYCTAESATTDEVTLTNFALISEGATANGSTSQSWMAGGCAINGQRHTNNSWTGTGSGYQSSGTDLVIEFNGSKQIEELKFFTLRDSYNYNVDPDTSETFTQYGVQGWDVYYWNGSSYVSALSVTSNNKVRRDFTVSFTTTKIKITTTQGSPDANVTRWVEVEAWGY